MVKPLFAIVLLASPIAADAMPVSTFLAKSDALMKKGTMAVFSSDLGLLRGEVKTSFARLRAEQAAARKAGRTPASCMPAKVPVAANALLDHLRTIPAAQRGMQVKEALGGWMAQRYPCPA